MSKTKKKTKSNQTKPTSLPLTAKFSVISYLIELKFGRYANQHLPNRLQHQKPNQTKLNQSKPNHTSLPFYTNVSAISCRIELRFSLYAK